MKLHPTIKGLRLTEDGEVWRDTIYRHKGNGVVQPYPEGWRNPYQDTHGYMKIRIDGKLFAVHRLVAETYIPNLGNLPQVHHIDEDKTNNHISNLMWVTAKDNNRFSHNVSGELTKGGVGVWFPNIKDFANKRELNEGHISRVLRDKLPSHKGWRTTRGQYSAI